MIQNKGDNMEINNKDIEFMETKNFLFEVKGETQKYYEFSGYGNNFKNKDFQGDISEPGSFDKTIKDNGNKRQLYYNHQRNMENNLGGVIVRPDNVGLFVEGKINKNERGKLIYDQMTDGFVTMMSIGFRVIKSWYEDTEGDEWPTRHITEYKLFEISVLPEATAANPLSYITQVKSIDDLFIYIQQNKDDIELRNKIFSLFGYMPEDLFTHNKPNKKSTLAKEPKNIRNLTMQLYEAVQTNLGG